jgi:hypothetical protein
MERRYREIRHRYADVVCGVTDYQMFRDIQVLLRYIGALHEALACQAARQAAELAFYELGRGQDESARTH